MRVIDDLKSCIEDLRTENNMLREMVDEIYYSPDMPGYIKAEADFLELAAQTDDDARKIT